jgi:hypothetical protein
MHYVYLAVCVLLLSLVMPAPVLADAPPPTPTLAVPVSTTTSATQTLQLQEFSRQAAYGVHPSTVVTKTTSSGSVWVIERRFTYGEAATVILLMAVVLVLAFDVALRLAVIRL